MSPNPAKDQNTGVLAGTGGEAVVKGAVPQSQGGPLVGDMTVHEFNQALRAHADDIKTHISDALENKIGALKESLESILQEYPMIKTELKAELGYIIAVLYDIKNGI